MSGKLLRIFQESNTYNKAIPGTWTIFGKHYVLNCYTSESTLAYLFRPIVSDIGCYVRSIFETGKMRLKEFHLISNLHIFFVSLSTFHRSQRMTKFYFILYCFFFSEKVTHTR